MGGNGGNGRQRETRGGNGRQRETTEDNGFLTVFVKTFRFVAEQAVRYNPRANPGEHGLSVVLGMHMHSRVSTMHSRVRIRDTSAILVNPWMSRLRHTYNANVVKLTLVNQQVRSRHVTLSRPLKDWARGSNVYINHSRVM